MGRRASTPAEMRKTLGLQGVSWTLEYHQDVLKYRKGIDPQHQRFILDSIDKLAGNYSASYVTALLRTGRLEKLHGRWKGFHGLRLRTWRVVYKEYGDKLQFVVIRVGHG